MKRQHPLRPVILCCLTAAIALAACAPRSADDLSSAMELSGMLQRAGATVAETTALAPPMSQSLTGQALQVNGQLLYVYACGSADEAQVVVEQLRSASGDLPWDGRVSLWRAGRLLVIYPGADGGLILLLAGLLGDPLTATAEGPTEPYPPAVAAAILAWAKAQDLDPATVEVVSYMPAEWLNGCLGLPQGEEDCTQGPVTGWVVELRAGEARGTAHTDELGLHVRLASAGN